MTYQAMIEGMVSACEFDLLNRMVKSAGRSFPSPGHLNDQRKLIHEQYDLLVHLAPCYEDSPLICGSESDKRMRVCYHMENAAKSLIMDMQSALTEEEEREYQSALRGQVTNPSEKVRDILVVINQRDNAAAEYQHYSNIAWSHRRQDEIAANPNKKEALSRVTPLQVTDDWGDYDEPKQIVDDYPEDDIPGD